MILFIQSVIAFFLTWLLSAFVIGIGDPLMWTESHRGIYVVISFTLVFSYRYLKKENMI